jgi:hypothetical protein
MLLLYQIHKSTNSIECIIVLSETELTLFYPINCRIVNLLIESY